ncbi:MAG: efflux RND transporter periplasmic adaptor subunit [Bacteroidales bacterium]|jgi:membrane fusion protein (multidrug efflux system)|nr:efflux RND transporter periplasmic adaptor subunit [Bacteroidales bacterium]
MKKIIVFAVVATMAACSSSVTNENLEKLTAKKDSLQKEHSSINKQLNIIDAQIAEIDTSINPNDLKMIKQIATQKNKIVAIEQKIKTLENKMTAKENKKLIPVAVKEIQNEHFDHYIIAFGEVKAKNYAMISPEMNGRVEKIYVKRGQQVSKESLLVSLNTDALNKQILGVKSGLDFATTSFNKQESLWKENIGSEIDYLSAKNTKVTLESQLESLEAQVRMSQIKAPFDGIVDEIFPKEGEMAGPAFPVIEFVNLKKLTIKAEISESHINKIKTGQIVELSFSSIDNYKIKTPIIHVSNVIASASRTFEIEMEINNPGEKIKPNMVSTIHINDYSNKESFVVPSLVIRTDVTGKYVYVVNKKGNNDIVEKKYITTGLSYDENTNVIKGLNAEDKVIVKGFHLVSAGVPVNVVK